LRANSVYQAVNLRLQKCLTFLVLCKHFSGMVQETGWARLRT